MFVKINNKNRIHTKNYDDVELIWLEKRLTMTLIKILQTLPKLLVSRR